MGAIVINSKRFVAPEAPPKIYWLGKSPIERLGWVKSCFITHPNLVTIFNDAAEKMEYCKNVGRFDAMLVIGGSGVGKTTLTFHLKSFAEFLYGFVEPERTICPVVQIQMPDPCTPAEISIAVLEALGDPLPRFGTRAEIFQRSKRMLRQCEVRLVLIDNFHDTPTKRGAHGMKLAGARIRDLMDESNALWILLGTKDAIRVRNSDPQLVKRVPYQQYLRYFSLKSRERIREFKRLLEELEKWLPLAETSCLKEKNVVGRVFVATEGILDRLISLTARGCIEAVRAGRETMLRQDLEKAFNYIFGEQDAVNNPFSEEFKMRHLKGPDEVYEVLGAA